MKPILIYIALLSYSSFGQDSSVYKSTYAGSHMIVPENENWQLDRVFVNGGEAYSIQVANTNFEEMFDLKQFLKFDYNQESHVNF